VHLLEAEKTDQMLKQVQHDRPDAKKRACPGVRPEMLKRVDAETSSLRLCSGTVSGSTSLTTLSLSKGKVEPSA
jgi:hypothetical protein